MRRGEELGYFAYGGSTIVAVFPRDFVTFDQDLVDHSGSYDAPNHRAIETLVKVGYSIGKARDI